MKSVKLNNFQTSLYESHSSKGEEFRTTLWIELQNKADNLNDTIVILSHKNEEFETIYPENYVSNDILN